VASSASLGCEVVLELKFSAAVSLGGLPYECSNFNPIQAAL
jgi:hypothetical protein